MASFLTFFSFLILFSTFFITTNGAFSKQSPITKSAKHKQKMTRLRFYFHDIVSGKHPTAVKIAGPASKLVGPFGTTYMMMDDPLTEGPKPSSKLVGRAQGIYALASQQDVGFLMVLNFAFVEGKYNGSTLNILGRNPVFEMVREMPIVGGSSLSSLLVAMHWQRRFGLIIRH